MQTDGPLGRAVIVIAGGHVALEHDPPAGLARVTGYALGPDLVQARDREVGLEQSLAPYRPRRRRRRHLPRLAVRLQSDLRADGRRGRRGWQVRLLLVLLLVVGWLIVGWLVVLLLLLELRLLLEVLHRLEAESEDVGLFV